MRDKKYTVFVFYVFYIFIEAATSFHFNPTLSLKDIQWFFLVLRLSG